MGVCNSTTKPQKTSLVNPQQSIVSTTVNNTNKITTEIRVINQISKFTKYEDVTKYYTFGVNLGFGSFGIVRDAINNDNKLKYAIKTVWKAQYTDKDKIEFIKKEIEIILTVEHENIIKCWDVFEDPTSIHFVFDLIAGGDLFDYITSSPDRMIPDTRAVDFFNQILDALSYLHSKNLVHRDIKPENFLIHHVGNQIKLKLIDFGFATFIKSGEKLSDQLGSLQYIAPEILKNSEYDTKVDMWAAGVTLYNMLTGRHPYTGIDESELINNVLNKEVNFTTIKNEMAKTLLTHLLDKNPETRFSANAAKTHSWIDNFINVNLLPTTQGIFAPKEENIKNILAILNQQSTIKNNVWNLLLAYLNIDIIDNLIKKLQLILSQTDVISYGSLEGTDAITYELLLSTMVNDFDLGEDLSNKIKNEYLVEKAEICKKHNVNYKSFLEKLKKCKTILTKERVWNVFKEKDVKGVGYIGYDLMCKAFSEYFPKYDPEKMKEIIKMSSIEKNNIKYDDFAKVWEKFTSINK